MRMRQVVGGVWGVLIQVVGVGKWALSGHFWPRRARKAETLPKPLKTTHRPAHVSTQSASVRIARDNRPTPAEFRTGAHRACNPRIRDATAASRSRREACSPHRRRIIKQVLFTGSAVVAACVVVKVARLRATAAVVPMMRA